MKTDATFLFKGLDDETLDRLAVKAATMAFMSGPLTQGDVSDSLNVYASAWHQGFRSAEIYLNLYRAFAEDLEENIGRPLDADLKKMVERKTRNTLSLILEKVVEKTKEK